MSGSFQGITATDIRLFKTEDKEFPICVLLENKPHKKAMSAAMTLEQALNFSEEIRKAVEAIRKAKMT